MFPMLLAIGPGITIPAGLSLLFGLGSLWKGWRSAEERKRITEPGELLGTGEPLGGLVWPGMEDLIAEGGLYSPRVRVAPLQSEETERVRDIHRGYLDQIVEIMEGSRLGGLSEDVGGLREEVSGRFRETIEDPTIITDAEMNAIIGRTMASNREIAESRARGMEGEAARRGLGPGQIAALTEQIAGGQRRADLEQVARVAEINAAGRAELRQRATEALGTVGGGLFGLEGELAETYEGRHSGALAQRASIEQPENLALIGDLMAETGRFNALLRSGAEGDLSNLYGNLSSGALQFLDSRLTSQAMQDYAESQSSGMFSSLGSAVGMGGSALVAGLLGAGPAGIMLDAAIGGGVGYGVGGLFD
ncbi:MAG: hypothetical protein KAU28_03075 [Phycisphaerae bacterium]|nr:hypothetical protein [Phycisphaerae bacterium]